MSEDTTQKILFFSHSFASLGEISSVYSCSQVNDFDQFIEKISMEVFDYLVLDESICKSLNLLSLIRAKNEMKMAPVFLVADEISTPMIESYQGNGPVDFLGTPISAPELISRLKFADQLYLEARSSQRQKEVATQLFRVVAHDISNLFLNFDVLIRAIESGRDLSKECQRLSKAKSTLAEVRDLLRNVKALDAMRSHSLVLNIGAVELHKCIMQVHNLYEDRLKQKSLTLDVNWHTSQNILVKAELVSLKHQVLGNILTNAIKFSLPNGKICIEIFQKENFVDIVIKDSGVGMTSEKISEIFNEQKCGSSIGTMGEIGTGYGMPLAYQFVKAYDGHINVQSITKESSRDNHGSTFIVSIPMISPKAA